MYLKFSLKFESDLIFVVFIRDLYIYNLISNVDVPTFSHLPLNFFNQYLEKLFDIYNND